MAFDPVLADRLREALAAESGITEKKMFGGLAFLCAGAMVCGIVGDDLMLRLGDDGAAVALQRPHVRPMDFTGKPLRSMVYVAPAGVRTAAQLRGFVAQALQCARSSPPRPRAAKKGAARRGKPARPRS